MRELDCRGLNCPAPVIKTKGEVEGGADQLAVRVDNQAAAINVTNFLTSQGFEAQTETQGRDLVVRAQRVGRPAEPEPEMSQYVCASPQAEAKTLVMIASNSFGRGDDELGRGLMANYLATLKEMGPALWRLVFVNSGVKLTIEGSASLEALNELEAGGVSILVCGTCLNYFDLLEKKVVGETTNMLDIVTSLQVADKVISLA